MNNNELQAIVAAILTVGSIDAEGASVNYIVNQYVRVFQRLQQQGGPTTPIEFQE